MIFGIGTDIVNVARIEAAMRRHGEAFAQRVLSTLEYAELPAATLPALFIAKRFAAKEAFAKATGLGLRHPLSLRRITVSHDALGKPVLVFDAELSAYLEQLGIGNRHLSISDERDAALAFVILERKD